jgi:hypothetical protein
MTATTHWTDGPLSALAMVRASILYDQEAEQVLSRYADDQVHNLLLILARHWLLDAAGIGELPAEQVRDNAVTYLDSLTETWFEAA